MSHVFISYLRDNKEQVDRLVADLRSNGVKVWLDRSQILPGQRWRKATRTAIKEGGFFLACFSREYMQRDRTYMNEELTLAIEELRQRPRDRSWFIPALLSGSAVPDLEIGGGETLRDLQWVDLSSDWNGGVSKILKTILASGARYGNEAARPKELESHNPGPQMPQSAETLPLYQRVLYWIGWCLGGLLALGVFLDALSNAVNLISPRVTYLGSLAAVFCWIAAELITRFRQPSWKVKSGAIITLKRLGPKLRLWLLGCLVLLWVPRVPRIWSIQKPEPELRPTLGGQILAADQIDATSTADLVARRSFSEGMEHLKSYDLPAAERLFCQAKRRDPKFLRARLYLARTWRDIGYDDAAQREAEEILATGKSWGIDASEIGLYEAFCAEIRGNWEEAIRGYSSLWDEKGIHAFDSMALVGALNLAGQSELALETIAEARKRYAEERIDINVLDDIRLDIERAVALLKGASTEQLAAAQEAERKARKIDSTHLVARAQLAQCVALGRMGERYETVCQQALAGFLRQKSESADIGKVYQVLGAMAADSGDALKNYEKALAIYRRLGFHRGISTVLVNIALALSNADREQEAALVCGAALQIASQIASRYLPEIRLNCLYYSRVLGRHFPEAREEAVKALALARQQENRELEVAALHSVAYMAHAMRDHEEALQFYREAMAMANELGDDSGEAQQTILLYAWLLSDLGRHSDARKELSRALKAYPSVSDRREVVAEVICFDRKHSILGSGNVEWLRMLKETVGFDPEQCGDEEDDQGTLPLDLDQILWEPIKVEERHC